jgi:deoxyribonuclease-4
MKNAPILGAHVSIAGGIAKAIGRADSLSINCFQVFTKNSNQWRARKFDPGEPDEFKRLVVDGAFRGVVSHTDYLTNMASPDDALWERSISGFKEELKRCDVLGIGSLVLHPGSHRGAGIDFGISRIGEALSETIGTSQEVTVLLETTAGQGTGLGFSFEQLSGIIEAADAKKKGIGKSLGVCFDTSHTFAAGYDTRSKDTYNDVIKKFDDTIGIEKLKLFHLNDSKKGLGSKVDRHEHIGWGEMGLMPFRLIMNDDRFLDTPKIIETPKENDYLKYDRINLDTLLGLVE